MDKDTPTMTFKTYMKSCLEDLKAWRRGEVRIAPRGATGRIYVRKAGDSDPSSITTATTGECIIQARVYRADTGVWEDLGTIAKGNVTRG